MFLDAAQFRIMGMLGMVFHHYEGRIPLDAHQDIVEVMRHAARQLPDGVELLELRQLLLQFLAFFFQALAVCYIIENKDQTLIAGNFNRPGGVNTRSRSSILTAELKFAIQDVSAGLKFMNHERAILNVRPEVDIERSFSDDFLTLPSGDFFKNPVDINEHAVRHA